MLTSYKVVYNEVAELHATGINQGFLSSLGVDFLALLYEAIDSSDDAILLVEYDRGRVLGFVSGAASLGPIYKALLRRPVRLISTLWPVLLSPVKLLRILELMMHTLRYFDREPELDSMTLPKFELISISVSSDERRSGVALRLYEALKEAAAERGFDAFKIVVGEQLDSAHKFYTRMGATPVSQTAVHGNDASIIYVQQI